VGRSTESLDDAGLDETARPTRDALMDAALDQLTRKGVLAGLNLRQVADDVGVTPANIYHYFGSRQGLLRATLAREMGELAGPIDEAAQRSFVDRRSRMFDLIASTPPLALTALLALDGDPDFEPLPFLDQTRAAYRAQVAAGEIPAGLDVDAVHLLTLATSIGFAIYGPAAARQLGLDLGDLHDRARVVFQRMLQALLDATP
jgi:AcrR family transcriptional regulator